MPKRRAPLSIKSSKEVKKMLERVPDGRKIKSVKVEPRAGIEELVVEFE